MSSDQDKDVVGRLFEAFDAVDHAAMDQLLTSDFVAHGLAPRFSEDRAGWSSWPHTGPRDFPMNS